MKRSRNKARKNKTKSFDTKDGSMRGLRKLGVIRTGWTLLNSLEKSEKSDNDEEEDPDEFDKIESKFKRTPYTISPETTFKTIFDLITMIQIMY